MFTFGGVRTILDVCAPFRGLGPPAGQVPVGEEVLPPALDQRQQEAPRRDQGRARPQLTTGTRRPLRGAGPRRLAAARG
eukprot:3270760-Lingulodinium_polyedra.AAC.1